MAERWLVSDTHFSHDLLRGLRGFPSIEEMDDLMVTAWNATVAPNDRVYHLGDVTMKRRFLPVIKRLNGKKRLIMGNHDILGAKNYLSAGFVELHGYYKLDNLWLSHVPLHEKSVPKWALGNVHGHIHEEDEYGPRYFNASVERIRYTPVHMDEIKRRLRLAQAKE